MSEPNYQEAFEELQQIVSDMEEGQITVDELTEKVARAAGLIRICKSKLQVAEQNVAEILASIESQEVMDDARPPEETSQEMDEDDSAEEPVQNSEENEEQEQ